MKFSSPSFPLTVPENFYFIDAYSDKILTLDWREHKPAAIKKQLSSSLPNFRVGLGNTQNFTVATSSGKFLIFISLSSVILIWILQDNTRP